MLLAEGSSDLIAVRVPDIQLVAYEIRCGYRLVVLGDETDGVLDGPELMWDTGESEHKDVLHAAIEATSQGFEEKLELIPWRFRISSAIRFRFLRANRS